MRNLLILAGVLLAMAALLHVLDRPTEPCRGDLAACSPAEVR